MKRKLYTILPVVLLLLASDLEAKTTSVSIPNLFPHYGSDKVPTPGPGTTQSRLISKTYLTSDGTSFQPFDSTTYSYSWGRGGQLTREDFDDNFISFDHSYTYLFEPGLGYRNQYHRFQTFTSANKAASYTYQSWGTSNSTWKDVQRLLYSYNSDQSQMEYAMLQIWYGGAWMDHYEYSNVYDSDDRLLSTTTTALKMEFTYNGDDVVERLETEWNSVQGWHLGRRYHFYYSTPGQMSSYIIEKFDNTWQNESMVEFTYAGTDVATAVEHIWDNGAWMNAGKHEYTYDQNHNMLSDVWQEWNTASSSYLNSSRSSWTYNSFDQPTTYLTQTWDAGLAQWGYTTDDFLYRYQYESYIPTGLDPVSSEGSGFSCYPVPASAQLNVHIENDNLKEFDVSVFDVQGRLVRLLEHVRERNFVLDLSNIPSGNYFLKVESEKAVYSRKISVAR